MPADARTLHRSFQHLNSGEIDNGRDLLIATSEGSSSLEALCMMVREFGLPPENPRYVEGFIGNVRRNYPDSSAAVALAFGFDIDSWTRPSAVDLYLKNERMEPAKGPFEAAARLFAEAASSQFRIVRDHTRPGAGDVTTSREFSYRGAAKLRMREADEALVLFRDGYQGAEETSRVRQTKLGANYLPSSDNGVPEARLACLCGEVVALRDLGRFREMGDALRRLRAQPRPPVHLLAPLEAEALELAAQQPFPSAWRKTFLDRVVSEARNASGTQSTSQGGGCMLPLAVTFAAASAAWWGLQQL